VEEVDARQDVRIKATMCFNHHEYVIHGGVGGASQWGRAAEYDISQTLVYSAEPREGALAEYVSPEMHIAVKVKGSKPPSMTQHARDNIKSRLPALGDIDAALFRELKACRVGRYQGGRSIPLDGVTDARGGAGLVSSIISFLISLEGYILRVIAECRHSGDVPEVKSSAFGESVLDASVIRQSPKPLQINPVSYLTVMVVLAPSTGVRSLEMITSPRNQVVHDIISAVTLDYPDTFIGSSTTTDAVTTCLMSNSLFDIEGGILMMRKPRDGFITLARRGISTSRSPAFAWYYPDGSQEPGDVISLDSAERRMAAAGADPSRIAFLEEWDGEVARIVAGLNVDLLCTDPWSGISLIRLKERDTSYLNYYSALEPFNSNYGGVEIDDVVGMRSNSPSRTAGQRSDYDQLLQVGLSAIAGRVTLINSPIAVRILADLDTLLGPIIDTHSNVRLPTTIFNACVSAGLRLTPENVYDASDVVVRWTLSQLFLSQSRSAGVFRPTSYRTHVELIAANIPPCVGLRGVRFYRPGRKIYDYMISTIKKTDRGARTLKLPGIGSLSSSSAYLFTVRSGARVVGGFTPSEAHKTPYVIAANGYSFDLRPLIIDGCIAMMQHGAGTTLGYAVMWCPAFCIMLCASNTARGQVSFNVIISAPSRVSSVLPNPATEQRVASSGLQRGRSPYVIHDLGYMSTLGLNVDAPEYVPGERL
jgi:hypothetical protein